MRVIAPILCRRMRVFVLFMVLVLCPCAQFLRASTTEESVSLTITDREGQALPFASVIVESAGLTYTADAQGQLRLKSTLFTSKGRAPDSVVFGKSHAQFDHYARGCCEE